MTRYSAAARALQELEPTDVSPAARDALLEMASNPHERAGVRLWAARAIAKLEPSRALPRFIELEASGNSVDDDAWLILGPSALPHLRSRCAQSGCAHLVLLKLALIAGASPSHAEARATIPLLLRESTRSVEARGLVYRSLGSFGTDLAPELSALQKHEDPTIREAATKALEAIR
jgi:HEAT repeat protein